MKEGLLYRAWKRTLQQVTSRRNADQLEKLDNFDWDIVVILDACRADVLQDVANWPIDTAISPAGCTPEWLEAVSISGVFDGAHVVSGNPQYEKVNTELDCLDIEQYWETEWNDYLETVPPEPILERVDSILERDTIPVVAHLQQPHWPYIAKLGGSWELAYSDTGPWQQGDDPKAITSFQVAMQRGKINLEQAFSAYKASVASVWSTLVDYIQQWLKQDARIIVTADHGETFGRYRDLGLYEHPCHCHVAPVVTVPWAEFRPRNDKNREVKNIEDQLEALGYVS